MLKFYDKGIYNKDFFQRVDEPIKDLNAFPLKLMWPKQAIIKIKFTDIISKFNTNWQVGQRA